MSKHVTYWLATPRASGGVTFSEIGRDAVMVPGESAPYFRKAFGKMTRSQAERHWRSKGYRFCFIEDVSQVVLQGLPK